MIQEDEYIIFVSQAKVAITSTVHLIHSQRRIINENRDERKEDRDHHKKMSILRVPFKRRIDLVQHHIKKIKQKEKGRITTKEKVIRQLISIVYIFSKFRLFRRRGKR